MEILDIKNPKFLKDMNIDELNNLAHDVRDFIIESVSKTGGHLSSNLGVVELTIALHYCFNAPEDKILFDVGHQCYTHKILTGRAKEMENLRQFNGIAGFQKRVESEYDCFEAGHSSTCLGAALGMAIARDLNKEKNYIVPVVGDGSIVSGLSLEALNQIGYEKRNMIIVFNDNNMSISKNVGALNQSINRLRNSKEYINLKDNVKSYLSAKKHGEALISGIHNFKEKIKRPLVDTNLFGNFDIYYIGPVDGHNIEELIRAFEVAKNRKGPVVIHCMTKKGKGYSYAEDDKEGKWHGVGPFDVITGLPLKPRNSDEISYSRLVADCVLSNMKNNEDIVTITPAMISGSCLQEIFKEYPERSYDVGIAEDLALELACGLSLNKKMPFVSIYSSFLQRGYDQLNQDVSRMNLPMVVGIDRASLVGEDGETHHGVFDISLIRSLPNCVLCEGKDAQEISNLIFTGFNSNTPYFIRYPRGYVKNDYEFDETVELEIGKWEMLVENKKPDAYILSYGNDLIDIRNRIENEKLNCNLVNCRYLKPVDYDMLDQISKDNKPVFIYTSDIIKGGLGDEVLEYYNSINYHCDLTIMGIDDRFVKHGKNEELKKSLGLDFDSLFDLIKTKTK